MGSWCDKEGSGEGFWDTIRAPILPALQMDRLDDTFRQESTLSQMFADDIQIYSVCREQQPLFEGHNNCGNKTFVGKIKEGRLKDTTV